MAAGQVERFPSWGSRIMGTIGLVVAAVVLLLGVVGSGAPYPPAAYPICGLVALALWAVLIRPGVAVEEGERLVLRNPLSTVRIPLAAIEHLVIRQWVAVRVADAKYSCAGVGRSHRQGLRDDQAGDVTGADIARLSYAGVVERRLLRLAEDARARQGIALHSEDQEALAADVRRDWARPEIATAAVLALAVLVALLL